MNERPQIGKRLYIRETTERSSQAIDLNLSYWIQPILIMSALTIGAVSCYLVASRTTTAYPAVRRVIVSGFVFGLLRVSLESLKFIPNYKDYALPYALSSNVLEQTFVILLAIASVGIYLESAEVDILSLLRMIRTSRVLTLFVLAIIVYSAFVTVVIAVDRPYSLLVANNLWGVSMLTMFYSKSFLELISPDVMALMMGVPTLLLLASRRTPNRRLRRNLVYLGLSALVIGVAFLAFTTYQNVELIETEGLLYLLLSIMFSSAALSFNRASVYAGFLGKPAGALPLQPSSPFSRTLKVAHSEIMGTQFLVEVDADSLYLDPVVNFCREFLSHGARVIVATSKAGGLFRALSGYDDIRFCLFSSSVSRPTALENERQILIPQDSLMDIIDIVEKMSKESGDTRFALVLDNLSDRLVSIGLEKTYRSLKEMLVTLSERNVSSLFLLHAGTMDSKALNLLRSLFTKILESTRDRLLIVK